MISTTDAAAGSYHGQAWADGPGPVYDRLAEAVVALAPDAVGGALVLDIGAGTGAASKAVAAAGGRPVALDASVDMLLAGRRHGAPAVAADAARLPVATDAADGAVAAFSLTHLDRPEDGFAEISRVTRPGGWAAVSSFGADRHRAKGAIDAVFADNGWKPPAWYLTFKRDLERRFTDPALLADMARAAGLVEVTVHRLDVDTGLRDAASIVRYRLGMAQFADHLASLPPSEQARLRDAAIAAVGPSTSPMLVDVLVLVARVAS